MSEPDRAARGSRRGAPAPPPPPEVESEDSKAVDTRADAQPAEGATGEAAAADAASSTAPSEQAVDDAREPEIIDLIPDEVGVARSQLAAGLASLAEGTLRRRVARLEAEGAHGEASASDEEIDVARTLLAETLWRQGRPLAARGVLEQVRAGSPLRRLPVALVIEAEALAASGEPDRAAGAMERVLGAVGVDAAWRLRAGAPTRLAWPLPGELEPDRHPPSRPPWVPEPIPAMRSVPAIPQRGPQRRPIFDAVPVERTAASRARMETARSAYEAGDTAAGDAQVSLALRMDPAMSIEALRLIEPTLGDQPGHDRLLLYGDLLRAAGRQAEAAEAYDRAAEARS